MKGNNISRWQVEWEIHWGYFKPNQDFALFYGRCPATKVYARYIWQERENKNKIEWIHGKLDWKKLFIWVVK